MAFLRTVPPDQADGEVREMYARAQRSLGHVPNWAKAFSPRPGVMDGWLALVGSVRKNMTLRRYELATLAAARALRSSYCSLAHGSTLASKVFDADTVAAIAEGEAGEALEPVERALMAYAAKVAKRADQISADDVDALRRHGLSDEEIFDVAAAAAARAFFAKVLDAVGAAPDSHFEGVAARLREALVVGRPIDDAALERLPEDAAAAS